MSVMKKQSKYRGEKKGKKTTTEKWKIKERKKMNKGNKGVSIDGCVDR